MTFSSETVTLIVAVVAIAMAGYSIWKLGHVPDFSELTAVVEDAVPVGQDFASVAQIVVNEAEQLKRTGAIPSNDAAFTYAFNKAKEYFPQLTSIDKDKLITAINSAVLVASALTAQIEQNKKTPMVLPMLPKE